MCFFVANASYLGSFGNAANTVVFPLTVVALSIATIFGQIVSALMSLAYLAKMKAVTLTKDSFRVRFNLMKRIIPLGITSFLSQISIVLSMAAVLNMVTKYGAMDPIFGQTEYAQIPTEIAYGLCDCHRPFLRCGRPDYWKNGGKAAANPVL